jgi:hypothetical protein
VQSTLPTAGAIGKETKPELTAHRPPALEQPRELQTRRKAIDEDRRSQRTRLNTGTPRRTSR